MRGVGLLLLLPLSACEDERDVIAWPGMEVTGFNRLNRNEGHQMRPKGSDWIGINSPATLVFRRGGQTIRFTGSRMGGGVQVASKDIASQGGREAPARVHTIVFNIGGSMEEIKAQSPLIAVHCDRLARMAGVQPRPIPDAAALRQRLRARPGTDVEVCGGRSATLTFQITALHDDRHWRHGEDYRRANFDGYLGIPSG